MNIKNDYYKEGLIFDRYLGLDVKLPYSYEDVRIQPNDTATESLVNLKFKHLYDNFLYLYGCTQIASNVVPISCTGIAGVSAGSINFTWQVGLSTSQFIPLSSNNNLLELDKITAGYLVKNKDKDQYSFFTSNGGAITVFNFDSYGSYISKAFAQNDVDAGYGVFYSNITAFSVSNDYLFVLDSKLNRLAKYDASGFTTGNNVMQDRLFYVDSIGNFGTSTSKTDFYDPRGLASNDSYLLVLDSGNSSIKKYDLNLNWVQTYRLFTDFASAYPIDISLDSNSNVYILTQNNKLFLYDNNVENKQVYDLNDLRQEGENFKRIVFSPSDNNVFYLISDKNVYKKAVKIPANTIGKYLLYLYKYDLPNDIINGFGSAISQNGISDRNVLFTTNILNGTKVGKIGNFYDNLNLFDVLAVNNFDIYNFDDIEFKRDEYVQNWVFNKALSKLIINHMRLRDQIIGKFLAERDRRGNVLFKGTRYLLINELDSIYFEQDVTFYVGVNEVVTNNSINRTLKKIYDIQVLLLSILKAETTNIPFVEQAIALN